MHCQAAAIAQLVRALTAMHKVLGSILGRVSFLFLIEGNALFELKSEIVQSWNIHPKGGLWIHNPPKG